MKREELTTDEAIAEVTKWGKAKWSGAPAVNKTLDALHAALAEVDRQRELNRRGNAIIDELGQAGAELSLRLDVVLDLSKKRQMADEEGVGDAELNGALNRQLDSDPENRNYIQLKHPDGSHKTNDEIRAEAANLNASAHKHVWGAEYEDDDSWWECSCGKMVDVKPLLDPYPMQGATGIRYAYKPGRAGTFKPREKNEQGQPYSRDPMDYGVPLV